MYGFFITRPVWAVTKHCQPVEDRLANRRRKMKANRIVLGVLLVALVAGVVFAKSGRSIPFDPYLSTIPKENGRPSVAKVEEITLGAIVFFKNTEGKHLGWLKVAVRAFYPDGTDEYAQDLKEFKNTENITVDFKFSKPSEIKRMNVSVSPSKQ